MADINWTPSSDLSSFYMGRMAPPIKLPDGTYIPTPNVLSVDQIYQGILPPSVPSTPLVSRSVNTVPVDSNGNPIVPRVGNNIPSTRETLAEQRSGWRPAVTEGVQPALTATMPPGARPSNIPLPSMPPPSTLSAAWDPFNTINPNADQSRLPPNDGGEAGFMAAFYPNAQNPAVSAIDQATGAPLPRIRPDLVMPFAPSSNLRAPAMPSPPANIPSGNYRIKSGDTLSALAKRYGTSISALANANGIGNPNAIFAGQTINVPPVPPSRPKATQAPQSPAAATRSPPSNATAVNTRGETVSKQTGTFYNPDTNKFEQRTVYR